MIPINLMIIGRSASRGALYGLGITLAYGTLGILAAVGGMAFGEIQGNPWFNAAISILFLILALAISGVFFIDFSKKRNNMTSMRDNMWPGLFAFFMGVVSAVLAGACVAPILIAVLLLTADLFAQGIRTALVMPLILGLGMALPWPFAGAGLQILPKTGAWMRIVNKIFGLVVLGFAIWYGYLSWKGFSDTYSTRSSTSSTTNDAKFISFASPKEFNLTGLKRPIIVDCWATWCKNCSAMESTTLSDGKVKETLRKKGFTFVKLQAEDIAKLKQLPGFNDIIGLPAFVIFE
jgi:thiol:disulfide interchange protein